MMQRKEDKKIKLMRRDNLTRGEEARATGAEEAAVEEAVATREVTEVLEIEETRPDPEDAEEEADVEDPMINWRKKLVKLETKKGKVVAVVAEIVVVEAREAEELAEEAVVEEANISTPMMPPTTKQQPMVIRKNPNRSLIRTRQPKPLQQPR